MAIVRSKNTGVATGGSGADFAANAMGTINECTTAAVETRLLASTDTNMAGVTVAYAKGTAAVPNRYLPFNAGNLSSFAALITDCLSTSGWVANPAGDVALSYLVATHTKYGTGNKMKLTFDAVPQVNTLQAYCPVANLSLAAFQNVCAWMQDYVGTCPANSLVIKLCTGNDGVTGVVATMTWTEAMAALSVNTPVCLNNGAALANGINSIAIYTGAVAPAAASVWAFDCFYATVAGFDLNSLLHKPWKTAWIANEVVGAAAIRVPTFGYRAPLKFQTTLGGTCGATEPDWDTAMLPALGSFAAQTITDGTVIWTCMGDDEAYYFWTIKSLDIANNRIEIDNHCANVGAAGRGYYGTDETAGLSYLTPFLYPMPAAAGTHGDSVGANGMDTAPKIISGGWTSPGGVDTITGVTVISFRNGLGDIYNNKQSIKFTGGIVLVRAYRFYDVGGINWMSVRHFFSVSSTATSFNMAFASGTYYSIRLFQYCWGLNSGAIGNSDHSYASCLFLASFSLKSFGSFTSGTSIAFVACSGKIYDVCSYNGVGYGMSTIGPALRLIHVRTFFATIAAFIGSMVGCSGIKNFLTDSSSIVVGPATSYGYGDSLSVQSFSGVTGDNRAYYPSMGYATFATPTWTIAVNNVNASVLIPMRHKVGVIACRVAGVQYTVSLAVNPSNTNLVAALKILGNTIAGVVANLSQSSSGSGLQTLTLTFTPLETGPVEVYLDLWLTNSTLTYTCTYSLNSFAGTQAGVAMRVRAIGDELFGDERVMAEQIATFPDATKVVDVATGGPASWGYPDGSTLGPGTAVSASSVILPTAGETWDGRAQYGIPGSLITPTRVDAIVSKVQSGYKYGDPAAQKTGTLVLLTPIRISSIKPIYAPKSGGALCEMVMRDAGATAGTIVLTMPDDSFEAITPIRWENELISFLVPASAELGLCDITVTADDTTTDTVDAAFEYVEDDCITARITADIVATLETLDSYGGVPGKVEEEKLIHAPNGRYPYVEVCGPVGSPNPQTTKVAMTELRYTIKHYTQANDEGDANPAISYLARNIIADIVKCLMVDQTRGNIALSTEQEEFGNAFLVDEASGAVEFCVYVNIMVRTRIDVNNPYSLG
jgi:hypothetical protein